MIPYELLGQSRPPDIVACSFSYSASKSRSPSCAQAHSARILKGNLGDIGPISFWVLAGRRCAQSQPARSHDLANELYSHMLSHKPLRMRSRFTCSCFVPGSRCLTAEGDLERQRATNVAFQNVGQPDELLDKRAVFRDHIIATPPAGLLPIGILQTHFAVEVGA